MGIDLEKIWRLLVAIFLLLIGISILLLAYIVFQNSALAIVGVYGAFILIPWGIGKGLFAIIDRNREKEATE